MPAQISLTYDANEDRLLLKLRDAEQQVSWWLTRRITLRLLKAWLTKLQEVAPPTIDMPWMPQLNHRKLNEEHALSLEFDAIRQERTRDDGRAVVGLVTSVNLAVTSTDSRLTFVAAGSKASVTLTRMESHAMVEALALHARQSQWLNGWKLPAWVGATKLGAVDGT